MCMSDRLIITNGEAAVAALGKAGVAGKVISWDDVLHDGPVPGGMSDRELRAVRAAYLARMGPEHDHGETEGPADRVTAAQDRLRERDETLEAWKGPILLWFEHDLYDQLQLIQILDRLGSRPQVWLNQMNDFVTHHSSPDLRVAQRATTEGTEGQIAAASAARWSCAARA